jgi:hypothetical protein
LPPTSQERRIPPILPIGQWREEAEEVEEAAEEEDEEERAIGEATSFRAVFNRRMSARQRECIFVESTAAAAALPQSRGAV